MGLYLIDTNSVSNYLIEGFHENAMSFLDEITDSIPNISVISKIELLSWKASVSVELIVSSFISDSNVFTINDDVVLKCVEIRRKRKIKTPDAIIAATAIIHGFTLITSNEKDFSNIKGLRIINPNNL